MSAGEQEPRAVTLLERFVDKNDFQAVVSKNEQGVDEISFITTEEVLSLEYLIGEFGDYARNYRIMATHPGLKMAEETSGLTSIPIINALLPHFGNEQPRINIQGNIEGKQLILIAPICRSICDNPNVNKEYFSGTDNYAQMRKVLQAITLARNERTWTRLVVPYFDCGKKDKLEDDHSDLPWMEIAEDLERYQHISNMITFFLHNDVVVNCFRRFRVDNTKMAPAYTRIIERMVLELGLNHEEVCLAAIDDSGVKKIAPVAEALDWDLFINYKKRSNPDSAYSTGTSGKENVKDKIVFVGDDLIQAFTTCKKGLDILVELGVKGVIMIIGGPDFTYNTEFSKHSIDLMLETDIIKKFIIFDTAPLVEILVRKAIEAKKQDKIIIAKHTSLLAHYIWRKILSVSGRDLRQLKPKYSLLKTA